MHINLYARYLRIKLYTFINITSPAFFYAYETIIEKSITKQKTNIQNTLKKKFLSTVQLLHDKAIQTLSTLFN